MALLVLVILVAFMLRLYRLGYQSIWYDEGVSIHLAMKDLRSLTLHTAGDIHPPLYYYLLHFWILAAGASEFSLAYLTLFFGVLIIPLSCRLARDLYGRRIGLLTAFLIGISPFNLWYSQEIRMYTLGAFLGLISLCCLTRLVGVGRRASVGREDETESEAKASSITDRPPLALWIGYILCAAAGLFTLYYFAFLLLFQNLFVLAWWLINRLKRREGPVSLARWVLVQGAVLLLYLPWLPIAARQALEPPVPPWRGFIGLGEVVMDSWAALALGQSVNLESNLIWPLLSFLFAIYLLGLLRPPAGSHRIASAILLCGYSFAPVLIIYLFSLRTPLFHPRYVFTYSPPFYLLLALGFARLNRASSPALAVSLVILTVLCGYSIHNLHFDPQYAADDHRGAADYVEERVAPGDAVLINAGYAYPPFLYYYERETAWRGRLVNYEPGPEEEGVIVLQTGVIGGDASLGWGDPASDFYATSEEETAQALERVFAHHNRVWVYRIYDTVTDPQGFVRDWLEGHGRMIGDIEFTGESYMRVQCYVTTPELAYNGEIAYHPLDVHYNGAVGLLGYEGPPGVRAGNALPLTLYWQARGELDADYSVFLGLGVTGRGDFAQVEEPLSPLTSQWQVGQVVSQSLSLEIPTGTPPVHWDLIVGMRDPATGQTLVPVPESRSMATVEVSRPLVPPRPPQMTHEPWANFGNLLQLVGYEKVPLEARPGDEIHLELLWRAWDAPLPLIQSMVELRDDEGRVQVGLSARHLIDRYPSILWESEELVRDLYGFQIPEDLSPGNYELTLTLQSIRTTEQRETLPVLSAAGVWEASFVLGTVQVIVAF